MMDIQLLNPFRAIPPSVLAARGTVYVRDSFLIESVMVNTPHGDFLDINVRKEGPVLMVEIDEHLSSAYPDVRYIKPSVRVLARHHDETQRRGWTKYRVKLLLESSKLKLKAT